MTPGAALLALEAGGRIRHAWLPGMRTAEPSNWRAYGTTDELAAAGEPKGAYVDRWPVLFAGGLVREPDLTDPATVGCLLALLREASGRAWASVDVFGGHYDDGVIVPPTGWALHDPMDWDWTGGVEAPGRPTEGEAIAAALVALAGAS